MILLCNTDEELTLLCKNHMTYKEKNLTLYHFSKAEQKEYCFTPESSAVDLGFDPE